MGLPGAILGDEGIGEDGEFSGDRGEHGLGWLVGGQVPFVEGLEVGVATCGRDGGQVEDVADARPAAADHADALMLAGFVGEGSEPGEAADLFGRAGAQFRQARDQGRGDHWPEAGDRDLDSAWPVRRRRE